MSLYIKTEQGWKPLLISFAPCPNSNDLQGVYRPENIEVVKVKLRSRLDRWIRDMQYDDDRRNKFSGDSYSEPLFGAFGEKL